VIHGLTFILVISKLLDVIAEIAPAVLAALASPRRQEILRLVWGRELSAGEIHRAMPDVTFGAVSLQLRSLHEAGLVDARADRRHRFYRARRERLGALGGMLEQMWNDALWRLKLAAELEQSRRGPRPRPLATSTRAAMPGRPAKRPGREGRRRSEGGRTSRRKA
jgi:DNA-binding transcriptional ArsR family regulator